MEQTHLEVLLEDIRAKFDLVLEGPDALRAEIREYRHESNEKHDLTTFLLKAIAADLTAHRSDTEAHVKYQIRE